MKITNYLLYHDNDIPYETIPSPNFSNYFRPEYLVLHCTTGFTVEDGVRSLIDPREDRPDLRVSAHLVIGREGRVVQLVPFNKCAWHCGPSLWNGIKGLNSRAIGIELVNAGNVERDGLGQWVKRGRIIPADDVVELQHPLDYHVHGWQKYPLEQVAATLEVAQLLFSTYGLTDVLGHDDINPQDRRDPGPAFPVQAFHARLLNLNEAEPVKYAYRTTRVLNPLRTGPGEEFPEAEGSPLPRNIPLGVLEEQGDWAFVHVLVALNGVPDRMAWIAKDKIEMDTLKLRHYHPPANAN